jgi:3-hydroxyacyl-CoA dehydrogenase
MSDTIRGDCATSVKGINVERIAVVGTGLIGASWAAHYLGQGFDVAATDPSPGAERRLRKSVEEFWPALQRIGLADGASIDRLYFDADLAKAVKGAGFVQENGPERLDIKRKLIAEIDAGIEPEVLIATSSSGIMISEVQGHAKHPERVVLGHPFNPPHLIPLVEVVGGKQTSAETIDQALAFYKAVGKKPIHIRREVLGHVANRLQSALWREAIYLLDQGVASLADIDTAIAHGPGLRWALLGPFLNLALSGGPGGMAHTVEHLGPPIESWWGDLGKITLTPKIKREVVEAVNDELKDYSLAEVIRQRDDVLLTLMALKGKCDHFP